MPKTIAILLCLIMLISVSLSAKNLQETLESLSGSAAQSYVDPMVSAFGANINGGWFHTAPKARFLGWDLEFGVVTMGTAYSKTDRDFNINADFNFTEEQATSLAAPYQNDPFYDQLITALVDTPFNVQIKGPTVVGDVYDDNATPNPDGTNPTSLGVVFSGRDFIFDYNGDPLAVHLDDQVFNLGFGGVKSWFSDLLPMAAPQLSIGTVAGTKLAFRYLPDTTVQDYGKVKYMGFGIQHNPAYWMPIPVPVDLGVSFFTQSLDLGSIIQTSATTYGLNVSKTFGLKLMSVTPYAGISAESSKMKFAYDYQVTTDTTSPFPQTVKVAFDVKGKNTSRMTLGSSFRLGFVNFNLDYNIAKYPSATAGFMVNLGW